MPEITCQTCAAVVTPRADGICPACGALIDRGAWVEPRPRGLDVGLSYPLAWTGVFQGVLAGILCFVVAAMVPKFEQFSRQLGITLPGLTEMVIALSHYSYIPIAFAVAWPFIYGKVANDLGQHRGTGRNVALSAWRIATWLFFIFLTVLTAFSVLVPLVKIFDELGNGPPAPVSVPAPSTGNPPAPDSASPATDSAPASGDAPTSGSAPASENPPSTSVTPSP
jgi:hypothetical protein